VQLVQGDEVLVRDVGHAPKLALEPIDPRRVDLEEHFEGDVLAAAGVDRLVDFAHAAGAERAQQLEGSEPYARGSVGALGHELQAGRLDRGVAGRPGRPSLAAWQGGLLAQRDIRGSRRGPLGSALQGRPVYQTRRVYG
jgi:hypothetical protein